MNSMFKKVSLACAVTAASVGMQAAFAAEPAQIISFTVHLTVPNKANVITVALDKSKPDNGSTISINNPWVIKKEGGIQIVEGNATRYLKVMLPAGIAGTKVALMTTTTEKVIVPLKTIDKSSFPGQSVLYIGTKKLDASSAHKAVDVIDYSKSQFGKNVPDLKMEWKYVAIIPTSVDLNGATTGDVPFVVSLVPGVSP